MSDEYVDPSGNTEAFRSFAQHTEPEASSQSRLPLIIGGVVLAVILIALVAFLALG